MLLLFLLLISETVSLKPWNPESWRQYPKKQIPNYNDKNELENVELQLQKCAPLVFAGECKNLQESLAKISIGNGFLLMAGDCAETFDDFSIERIRDTYRVILQMGIILSHGTGVPTIKVGRMAGQFAKPRSDEYEIINNIKIPVYRGDIINDVSTDKILREPEPKRMLLAYYQSLQTLNLLRAFTFGGYADISRIHAWNLDFVEKTNIGSKYRIFASKIDESLKFIKALGLNIDSLDFKQTSFYTAHECLLLNYEQALTRQDSITNKWFGCSGHLLWIGERTRDLDGAHIEYIRGINNPIGIKLSEKCNPEELIEILDLVNPEDVPGKIVLITRMGQHITKHLPILIREIQKHGKNVVWCCDPMHGNTYKTSNGIKTRNFDLIKQEVFNFIEIHKKMNTIPGGIHLEMTGQDVTECIGGNIQNISENDLKNMYLSQCDPRLNSIQSLEISFLVSELLQRGLF